MHDLAYTPLGFPEAHCTSSATLDDVDAIEVIASNVTAIPIETSPLQKTAHRHGDEKLLNTFRQYGSLAQRHLEEDIDMIDSGSSDIDMERDSEPGYGCRGRRRYVTKSSVRTPREEHDDQRYNRQKAVRSSRHRSWQDSRDETPDRLVAKEADSEQDAVVFDNFEDPLSLTLETVAKTPYENQLHFVRSASSVCVSPGAAPVFTTTPTVHDDDGAASRLEHEVSAKNQTQRERHLRRLSAPLQAWGSSVQASLPLTRRRATLGSDSAYKHPEASIGSYGARG